MNIIGFVVLPIAGLCMLGHGEILLLNAARLQRCDRNALLMALHEQINKRTYVHVSTSAHS
jgi:hypothetical protein